MRTRIGAGNWKMNLGPDETLSYFRSPAFGGNAKSGTLKQVIFVPAYDLSADIQSAASKAGIELGAQNVHWEEKGAFTGELSAKVLKAMGVDWTLVGHSERRKYFGETDETAARRFKTAAEADLNVIYCIGETLREREAGTTEDVLTRQSLAFLEVLGTLIKNQASPWPDKRTWCLAYEPVWAIGTGKTATNEQAEQAHRHIRKVVWDRLGMQAAQSLPILYGGSVTPENVSGIATQPNVDGVLVGGASLKPDSFARILASI